MPLHVAITGASGLIGTALRAHLSARGDTVYSMVRRTPRAEREVFWDPAAGVVDIEPLRQLDVLVHLAGAGVGDHRWTRAYRQEIYSSRINGTRTVVEALRQLQSTDRALRLVSGSAVGFYGSDRGDEVLTEESAGGSGFLAGVVHDWEAAALAASFDGVSVACARTGLVMAPHGGAFARLLTLARLGLGGPLGSGKQWWPWITLADEVRALTALIDRPELTGPVNVVGPDPARQRDIASEIGRQLRRPAVLPAPAIALRLAVGEFAADIVGSQRVIPQRLVEAGFVHEHGTLPEAVRYLLTDA